MGSDTLTITGNRTGKSYVIPVQYGTYAAAGAAIWATDLRQIKVSEDDFGLMSYDPGFMNTAAARSRGTFVDGERGILRYRGDPRGHAGGALHVLSRGAAHPRPGGAPQADDPADCQDAHPGRLRLPTQPRIALRLST